MNVQEIEAAKKVFFMNGGVVEMGRPRKAAGSNTVRNYSPGSMKKTGCVKSYDRPQGFVSVTSKWQETGPYASSFKMSR